MRERRLTGYMLLVGALVACVLGLVLALALAPSPETGPAAGIELLDGVPVGVERSPAGALAAADNYLALASQSLEQDPAVFAALVGQAYAPDVRASALAQAAQLRASDPQNMSNYAQGGLGLAVIAARRLDSYTPEQATVTSWLGGFVWGPELAPRQTWSLVDTTLRWESARWLVVASRVDATPAPVPSIVYVNGTNDESGAFARLAGMSAPFYGSGE
jgi:hypothetical protein